jgi:hypothetical protein
LGSALQAVGGKFMTRQHVSNAKISTLQGLEAKKKGLEIPPFLFPARRPRTRPDMQVENLAKIVRVDPGTVWSDHDPIKHSEIIKHDIWSLVTSMAVGGRPDVPRNIVLNFLNSIADYLDKSTVREDGKSLLDTIVKIQVQCGIFESPHGSGVNEPPNTFNGNALSGNAINGNMGHS